ncbi:MAG: glycine--tRNA ligase subunit beta [Gammaproteobacteria bacterium]|nr:glycine--tRNA ligase subunit beta [Gammaproteobacteria bacterium]
MSRHDNLLVELGTEELPPKALLTLSDAFAAGLDKQLRGAGFEFQALESYATPRRLALRVEHIAAEQPERVETRRGPALGAAFDASGAPTKAAQGFARSCGVEVSALGRLKSDEGEWLCFEQTVAGRRLFDVLPDMVNQALAGLPIPKRMRWGAHTAEFVRPAHWVVMLYGSEVIAGEVLGLKADRVTHGHRFMHGAPIALAHADDYVASLATPGYVIAPFAARRERVRALIEMTAQAEGGTAVIDEALLDEVTALVEWPVPICGSFDAHFLELPGEVLIASMQGHQKYFPIRDAHGGLRNRFITLANLESAAPEAIRSGNERVIRPRLSDADFFYRADRAKRLDSRLAGLDSMMYEKRLGSLGDKTRRIVSLAATLASACGADSALAGRAAELSRCDLLSDLVGEFPELQGTMGSYYAAADGEAGEVSVAIGEFYQPRFSGDAIPATEVGRAVALADKLDSLVGIFGIGSAPTGDRDPFALRRAAIGLLRIIIESDIALDLRDAIDFSLATYAGVKLAPDTAEQVYGFVRERLRGYYLERGTPNDVCTAVFANDPGSPAEVARRLTAVSSFRALPAAAALAAANKRIANILKKLDTPPAAVIDDTLLADAAERELAARYAALAPQAEQLFNAREYTRYMELLASLREPVDAFFDGVMVMCDDAALRANRLALLARLHALFTRVADIARLHDA